MTHTELKESQTPLSHRFCLSACLSVCTGTFMSSSQCVTLCLTWRRPDSAVSSSLVAERSRVQKTRRDSPLWGNIQPKASSQHTELRVILDPFTQICEHSRSGQWKHFPSLLLGVTVSVTLLGWISPAQRAPPNKLGWIKGSAEILLPHAYVCVCVCVCVSVTAVENHQGWQMGLDEDPCWLCMILWLCVCVCVGVCVPSAAVWRTEPPWRPTVW